MNDFSASRNNFLLGKYAPGRIIEKTFNNTPRGGVFLGGPIYEKLRYSWEPYRTPRAPPFDIRS